MRQLLFGHPLAQAIGLGLFGILANVLSGAYVFQITEIDQTGHQALIWSSTLHSPAFWGLVVVLLTMGLYGWAVARVGNRVRKALTDADVRARAFEILLDPLLDQMKGEITQGKLRSMSEVFTMLGLEKDSRL